MQSGTSNLAPDDDSALEPAQMLALLRDQQRTVERRLAAYIPFISLAWAVAWLVGFGALWLIDGARPVVSVPLAVAVTIFVALMVMAIALSAVLGARSARGVRSTPATAFTGAVYGITWSVATIALAVFGAGMIANGMSEDLANIFYPTAYTLIVGVLYMIAGGIWRAIPALVAGVWIVVVSVVAPFFGYPTHYLVFALAGGGAFLTLAGVTFAYTRTRSPAGGVSRDG